MELKRQIKAARKRTAPSGGGKTVGGVLIGGPQGPERKKYESLNSNINVTSTAPYVQSLTSGIAQGTGVSQRVGDRIHIKAVDILFDVQQFTPGSGNTFLDVFLIADYQPDETVASAAQIFVTPSSNLTYIALDNLERFQILRRERITMDPAQGECRAFNFHLSADLGTRFSSSTGAPSSNDLLVCALCPETGGASAVVSYLSRLTYTDE